MSYVSMHTSTKRPRQFLSVTTCHSCCRMDFAYQSTRTSVVLQFVLFFDFFFCSFLLLSFVALSTCRFQELKRPLSRMFVAVFNYVISGSWAMSLIFFMMSFLLFQVLIWDHSCAVLRASRIAKQRPCGDLNCPCAECSQKKERVMRSNTSHRCPTECTFFAT